MGPELLLLVALAGAPADAAASADAQAPADAAALAARLRAVETFRADFVETKTMALFSKPLVTRGQMAYRDPGELARRVTSPRPSRVVVTEGALLTIRDGRAERLELGARPEARALVTALLSLLRGDLDALRVSFEVRYEVLEEGARWRLTLEPDDARVAALVERITLEGEGDRVTRYAVREASGDEAVTEVTNVEIGVRFDDPGAWFGPP